MDSENFSFNCELNQSMIVEASAGTGKTYNIQNLFLRYIVEMGVEIDHILVVTFTKAAAAELKDRLRLILKLAYRYLNEHDHEYEDFKRLKGFENLLKTTGAKTRLAQALAHFDQAHISTIHGFCQEILHTNAFECCTFFEHELCERDDDFKQEVLLDYYREQIYAHEKFQYYFIKSELNVEAFFNRVSLLLSHPGCLFETASGKSFTLGKDLVEYPLDESMNAQEIQEALFLNAVQAVYQRLENYKLSHGLLTFNDLLKRVHSFLTDPKDTRLKNSLKAQFKVVFIDEFQDTDQIQYEIFKSLHDRDHYLIFVGDPKQAIYGFRGGNVNTYVRARDEMLGQGAVPQNLTYNYRSDKQLVTEMNKLFGGHNYPFGLPHTKIMYTNVDTPSESNEEKPLRCEYFDAVKAQPARTLFNTAIKACCERVQYLLETPEETIFEQGKRRRIEAKDIAILLFKNNDVREVQKALRQQGINAIIYAKESIYQTEEARDLLSILDAVLHFTQVQKIYHAMLTPYLGYTLEDLTAKSMASQLEVIQEKCMILNGLWREHSFQSMMMAFKHDFEVDLKLASQVNAAQKLAYFNALIDLVDAAIREEALSPEYTLEFLSRQQRQDVRKGDEDAPRESDEQAVQVMTYHMSKGLEFPIVILPDLYTRIIQENRKTYKDYTFYRQDQQVVFISGKDDAKQAAKEATLEAQFQEDLRLIYVGMTRAKNRCYFYWGNLTNGKNAMRWLLGMRNVDSLEGLFCKTWDSKNFDTNSIQTFLDPYLEPPVKEARYEPKKDLVLPLFTPSKASLFLLPPQHNSSFTSLTTSHHGTPSFLNIKKEDDEFEKESLFDGGERDIFSVLASNITGNAWHEIFEVIDFQKSVDTQLIESILNKYSLNPTQENQYVQLTTQMVETVLSHTLDQKQLKLNLISPQQRLSELEFYFPIRQRHSFNELFDVLKDYASTFGVEVRPFGDDFYDLFQGYFKGFIDLVFEYEGKFYIIDWKSNSLSGRIEHFSPEYLRLVMGKSWYFLQYLIYCVALMKYIRARTQLDFATAYDRYFGGVFYLFLRGIRRGEDQNGIFAERPPRDLLEKMETFLS